MIHSLGDNPVYLLLIVAENEWDGEGLQDPTSDIYKILAEGIPELIDLTACGPGSAVRFTLKHAMVVTVAARVPIGLVDTALITRALLEALQPSIVAQVGFGGILSDDLRLGDVAVASHVDCYLTKDKAVQSRGDEEGHSRTEVVFAGEVFRPSHSLVQLAMNLKYAYPAIYGEFQSDARQSLRRVSLLKDPSHEARRYLRSVDVETNDTEVSLVHVVHFASAEIVSTTAEAVRWLRSRDRKLAIVDMESGGFLAAVWEYCHRHTQSMETLVIRGGGGYGDERHEGIIKRNAQELHRLAFENACHFLCRLLSMRHEPANLANESRSVDVGILIPLEEEFSYFIDFLQCSPIGVSVRAEYREGRYYYLFERGRLTCAATFVGDMGLVKMALGTEDLYHAFTPSTLVILGIAAGFSGPGGDVKICDVTVAKSIDVYFHKAYNRMGTKGQGEHDNALMIAELREKSPIPTSQEFITFIIEDQNFAVARSQWSDTCTRELAAVLEPFLHDGTFNPEEFGVAMRPEIRGACLASGEFVAAARGFVDALADRGCNVVDMEAGGAAIAYQRLLNDPAVRPSPKLLVLRGISDRGDEKKSTAEVVGEPNMFRRACMRNASRLLLLLLENEHFASMLT